MLRDLVEGKVTVEDHVEPASLVVRASCGCNPAFHDAAQSDEDSYDREQLTVWMDAVFDIDVQRRQAWVDPLIDVLYRGATAGSLEQFEDLLARVLRRLAGQALEPAVVNRCRCRRAIERFAARLSPGCRLFHPPYGVRVPIPHGRCQCLRDSQAIPDTQLLQERFAAGD